MSKKTTIREHYDKIEDKINSFKDSITGKIILSPFILIFKVVSVILVGVGIAYGAFRLITSKNLIETDDDVDYIPGNSKGEKIINKEIINMRKKIDIINNPTHKNNYENLTEEELKDYISYEMDNEMPHKSIEDKKRILITMKKIDNIQTPGKSISDLDDLYD